MSPLETESPLPWTRGFLYSKTATLPRLVRLIQIPNWMRDALCSHLSTGGIVDWAPHSLHAQKTSHHLSAVFRASQSHVNLITWAQYPGHPNAKWISSTWAQYPGHPRAKHILCHSSSIFFLVLCMEFPRDCRALLGPYPYCWGILHSGMGLIQGTSLTGNLGTITTKLWNMISPREGESDYSR